MKNYAWDNIFLFEHRFWLQIMGDHARFINMNLGPNEEEAITESQNFIQIFDALLEEARQNLSLDEIIKLTQQADESVMLLRAFKLQLLERHLVGNINIGLPPTFINHMVNELEEYLRVIKNIQIGRLPKYHPVHHHLLWLLDAKGHTSAIISNLDEIEKEFKDISMDFQQRFIGLYFKALEIKGYLRTGLSNFPALDMLNHQVERDMIEFREYLLNILDLLSSKELLGTFKPLAADHMAREECYYLIKLAQVSDIQMPNCDPTKPRVEMD